MIISQPKKFLTSIDWSLVLLPFLIGGLGLLVLSSAGYDPDSGTSKVFSLQAWYLGLAALAYLTCACISPSQWKRLSYLVFILGLGFLVYLLIFGGIKAGGASRWLDVGLFRIQPSEFMKLGSILMLAKYFSSDSTPPEGYHLRNFIVPVLLMLVPAFLVIRQPDLGTGLSILAIGFTMLFVAGLQIGTMFRILFFLVVLTVPIWHFGFIEDYQKQRVLTFLSPEKDPLGKGYHSIQSKIAVGSGAILGKGFRKGTQTQLRFLPEQTTDFVFSVLAEEWGFVGSITVIGLYLLLILQLLASAIKMSDPFSMYVTVGTAALIFWHTLLNIGMVIGVLPVVGITLSIFSYGGSSLITTMALLGIVAGFTARRYMFS